MMARRVQRRVVRDGEEKVDCPEREENASFNEKVVVDWTKLPYGAIIQISSCLSYRDRANFSSTCRRLRSRGRSPYLWQELDLRFHECDATVASSLASRCKDLQKIRFFGAASVYAILNINAKNLREIRGDQCQDMTDATLVVLAARHEALESLHIRLGFCGKVSSEAVQTIAYCCPKLQTLWLSGICMVDADAINALGAHCQHLIDIGFIDCQKVELAALGNVASVRFLSVAGTKNINWTSVLQLCSRLPDLIALDVSRTNITPSTVSRLFSSLLRLKVLCALNCELLEEDPSFAIHINSIHINHKGKVLLSAFTDILKVVATLFSSTPKNIENVFLDWRKSKVKASRVIEILNWLERVISDSLLHVSERKKSTCLG